MSSSDTARSTEIASQEFRILSRRREGGFQLCEQSYSPNLYMPTHEHELPHFCAVVSGGCTYHGQGAGVEVAPSRIVLVPADRLHSTLCSREGAHLFILSLSAEWAARLTPCSTYREAPSLVRSTAAEALMRRLYRELRQRDSASTLAITGLSIELIAETLRQSERAEERGLPRWLRQVRDLLDDRIQEPPTVEELALSADVHPAYLTRRFRRQFGCSLGDYVRGRRVAYAAMALASGNAPLVEIALEAGFCDQAHFSKVFKQSTGLTPSEFRRQRR